MRVLIVDNYDSYTWNLLHLVWKVVGEKPSVVKNDEMSAEALLKSDFTHIIISPGPGTPVATADFGVCSVLLKEARVPCLGVCLGHQGLAWSFGATVTRAPEIMHGRLSSITHDGTGIFAGIPQEFKAVRYHSLSVIEPVPADLIVTARAESSVIMGLAHRTRPLFGVQFHPESVETQHGEVLMNNFLQMSSPSVSSNASQYRYGFKKTKNVFNCNQNKPSTSIHVEPLNLDIDVETLFTRVFSRHENTFWLDSARKAYDMGRFSFIGSGSSLVRYFAKRNVVEEIRDGKTISTTETIFEYLRRETDKVGVETPLFPFQGGFVGYLGYGIKGTNGIGKFGSSTSPDAEFVRVERFAVCDHEKNEISLVSIGQTYEDAQDWFKKVRLLASIDVEPLSCDAPTTILNELDFETYDRHFEEVQRWLKRGDSYQACYTYQIRARNNGSPLAVYLRLRKTSPAPYSAFLQFGVRSILSSSPERFVKVDGDGWAEAKPIKGTCPRVSDPFKDELARKQLQEEEKTRSENLMIVDLLRNDLGMVCDKGTISVPRLMAVETYSTLHQLVSTVRGKLLHDVKGVDCVRSLFPGGSMTGSPKLRSVELLDELEPDDRGIYSGSIGYFSYDGQVDQSIVIRTIVWEGNSLSIGVGGALTVMSVSKSEYEETQLKARALLMALGITDNGLGPSPIQ